MAGQRPPTTSGITIVSGSLGFDSVTSDFPIIVGVLVEYSPVSLFEEDKPLLIAPSDVDSASRGSALVPAQFAFVEQVPITGGFAPDANDDISITTTSVTTSGITVVEFYPGAGLGELPFVPPVVLNERLFPITSTAEFIRTFPEENRRVYPVLPQFSILTPGD